TQTDRFVLVMHYLNEATPGDLFFNKIDYNNNSNILIVNGILLASSGKGSMADFLAKANKSKYFKSVDLIYLQQSDKFTVETYDFELKCVVAGGIRR
ncbi:PilN domain-containing protein, partial [Candidatus Margulisiibacteriota bacterium]